MKKVLFTFLVVIGSVSLYAQPPESFSYHAIVRNKTGDAFADQAVSFRFGILKGSPVGAVIYGEKHDVLTDSYGSVSLVIGNGTDITGDFVTIHTTSIDLRSKGGMLLWRGWHARETKWSEVSGGVVEISPQ